MSEDATTQEQIFRVVYGSRAEEKSAIMNYTTKEGE